LITAPSQKVGVHFPLTPRSYFSATLGGAEAYDLDEGLSVLPLRDLEGLAGRLSSER